MPADIKISMAELDIDVDIESLHVRIGGATLAIEIGVSGDPVPPPTEFVPDSIDGLVMHFDAAAISGLSDGDKVALWPGSSGKPDAVQGQVDVQPTYQSGIIGSLPVVRFTGKRMDTTIPFDNQQGDIFIVTRLEQITAAYRNTLISSPDSQPYKKLAIGLWIEGDLMNTNSKNWIGDGSAYSGFGLTPSPAFIPGDPLLLNFRMDTNTQTVRLNNDQSASTTISLHASDNYRLGSESYNVLRGDLAMVIAYDRPLTTSQRNQVSNWLIDKFGLGD